MCSSLCGDNNAGRAKTTVAPLRTRHLGALWRGAGHPFYAEELLTFVNAWKRSKAPIYVFYAQVKREKSFM